MRKTLAILLLTGATFLSGCGDSDNFVFTGTNNGVLAAPLCQDDAYTTNEDTALTVNAANGVLANDTPNGGTVTFAATSQNGTVAGNADGSFTYTPNVGFTGQDIFTYTVANASGQATCTVTITVQAVNGFFVDAVNGNDGTGSFQGGNPYATIQAAVADAPANADIIVRPGNYTGTVALKDGQRLLGSGSVLAQGTGVRPQLTGPVDLADGNTLDFLRIDGTNDDAVDGDGQNGGTVTNCEVANTTGGTSSAIELVGARGTWTVTGNVISNISAIGLSVTTTGSDAMTLIADNNQISNASGAMVFVSGGNSDIKASIKGNTFTSSAGLGNSFELTCGEDSTFCLDLENNTNDDVYALLDDNLFGATAVLSVEQLNVLTDPQPGGAGNTGTVDDGTGIGGDMPTNVADGFCGF